MSSVNLRAVFKNDTCYVGNKLPFNLSRSTQIYSSSAGTPPVAARARLLITVGCPRHLC